MSAQNTSPTPPSNADLVTLVVVYSTPGSRSLSGRRVARRVRADRVLSLAAAAARTGKVRFMFAGPHAHRVGPSSACWRWHQFDQA